MTRDEAIAIRQQQLQGKPVKPELVQEAIATIKSTEQPLTETQVNEIRRKQGKTEKPSKPARARRLKNPVFTQEPCPCGTSDCEADPPAVVKVLKPWTLLKPGENDPAQPEAARWPTPQEASAS